MAAETQTKKNRKGCRYTDAERAILSKYKDDYRALTNHEDRTQFIKGEVFVDLCNHWKAQDGGTPSEEQTKEKLDDLCNWIRNNWRSKAGIHHPPANRKPSKLDILWRERQNDIVKEIQTIHEEQGRNGPPDQFGLRNAAASRVYEQLSEDEKAAIEKQITSAELPLNPPEIQRKRASRYGRQAVSKWALDQWRDKGMMVLTFYAYRGDTGRVYSEVHEEIATNAGQNRVAFIDAHEDLTTSLQVKFLEYVKQFLEPTPGPTGEDGDNVPTGTAAKASEGSKRSANQSKSSKRDMDTQHGYPVMPEVDDTELKDDLEDLLRRYLTAQYKLASGKRKDRLPFSTVYANVHHFVDPRYYPKDFTFEDPRNLRKEVILSFCRHVKARQDSHGVSEAFRFLSYQSGKDRMPADYGTRADEERAAKIASSQRSARKSHARKKQDKDKGKGKQRDPGPDGDSGTDNERHQSDPSEVDMDRHDHGSGNGSGSAGAVSRPTREPNPEADIYGPEPPAQQNNPQYQLAIDPALIDENHGAAGPSNHGRPDAGHEHILPDPTHILITGPEMQRLEELGHPTVIPVNGPSDGLPMYSVPAAVRVILDKQPQQEQEPVQENIQQPPLAGADHQQPSNVRDEDQVTRRTKVPATRRRGNNADMRTIAEGQALLKKEGRSRSGTKLRRR